MIELRHLRYFLEAAHQLHFARAAERLGIAAPTLTVQIQEIERTLGTPLFVRRKRAVTLTAAGEAFRSEAEQALQRFDDAVAAGKRAGRGASGRLAIGYVGSAALAGTLQATVRSFRSAWPEVHVDLRECSMASLPARLESGSVDVAFVRLPMPLPAGIAAHVLSHERFCVALPSDHRLAAQTGSVRAAALKQEWFVMPEQENGTWAIARRGRFSPQIAGRPGSLMTVLTHVSLGLGVAILPEVVIGRIVLHNVVFKPLAGEPVFSELGLLHRTEVDSPVIENFLRHGVLR